MCALTISAEDTTNPDNKKSTESKVEGAFPGTVCFYRSEQQREQEYGSDEDKNNIPSFGFDVYIPKLHGKEAVVADQYKMKDYIMTAYTASVKSKKGEVSDVNVRLYPAKDEWVEGEWKEVESKEKQAKKDKKPIKFKDRKECKYYPSWINPTATSMTIYAAILFPEAKNLTDGDDFIEYKKNPESTAETIYFKIVKVDDNWNPAKRTKWNDKIKDREDIDNQFVGLSENEPLLEQEKQLYSSQIVSLKARRDGLTVENQNLETELNNSKQAVEKMTSSWTEEEVEKKKQEVAGKVNKKYPKHAATQADADEILKTKRKEIDDGCAEIDQKHKFSKENKQHPDHFNQAQYDILTSRQAEIRNRTAAIRAEQRQISQNLETVETLYNKNTFRPSDDSLEITPDTHTFTFTPEKSRNCHTAITLTRKQNKENIKAALIAYYKRSKKVKDEDGTEKSIEEEYIVGQVNILPLMFYKTLDLYRKADSYATSIDMPVYFNPVPLHFVKVTTQKDTDKNATDWNLENTIGISLNDLTHELGKYTDQAGIKVQNLWETGVFELTISEKDGKKNLKIESTDFPLDSKNYVDSKIKKDITSKEYISLDDEIKKLYSRHILNSYLYANSTGTPLNATVADSSSCPKHTSRFKEFLKEYPQLLRNKGKQSERLATFNLAKAVADFLVDHVYIVFMINGITGSDGEHTKTDSGRVITETESGAAAYTYSNSNRIFMFKKSMESREKFVSTLIHELGHSLGLQHTFHKDWKMFPKKVSFDGKWDEKIAENALVEGDYKGYGATYDNIMDYGKDAGSKNSKYFRRIFSLRQWMTMNESLIRKSKEVYDKLKDAGVFKYLDESRVKEEDKITDYIFIEGSKLGYAAADFIQEILNLGMGQPVPLR